MSDDEEIIQDITYATNSQNPVDFRDLKSNDTVQLLLEKSAQDLGYVYKRKRDHILSTNAIPSTVAAEAVFAVWRERPHLAKYRRNEFFDQYYNEIFNNLNAAQMVMAVLIFRYCDSNRKQISPDKEIQAHRPYSQYFLAYMMGKYLLQHLHMKLDDLTHKNFREMKDTFEGNKAALYHKAEQQMAGILADYFNYDTLGNIDGRTMSAAFRRFDIMERYLKK